MPKTANQILGRLGERLALEHYERLGFALLARNYRTLTGEIDVVVCDHRTTVFVEVKTRRAGGLDPALSITALKRRRMRALAAAWLADHPARPRTPALRIDAVAIVVDARGGLVSLEQFEDVA
jgi:putative endonuclease